MKPCIKIILIVCLKEWQFNNYYKNYQNKLFLHKFLNDNHPFDLIFKMFWHFIISFSSLKLWKFIIYVLNRITLNKLRQLNILNVKVLKCEVLLYHINREATVSFVFCVHMHVIPSWFQNIIFIAGTSMLKVKLVCDPIVG